MKRISILLIVATIALTTLACGISIDLPVTRVSTGPTVTDDILVPFSPSSLPVDLTLSFGAGELKVAPGAQDGLVASCRMIVKTLRQRAGLAAAEQAELKDVATEIRARTQKILRNPTAYEAPRH